MAEINVTKKPLTYKAFEFTGENRDEIRMALVHTKWSTVQFVTERLDIVKNFDNLYERKVKLLFMGWYMVVSSKGKVWVCSPEKFKEDWEKNEN